MTISGLLLIIVTDLNTENISMKINDSANPEALSLYFEDYN